MGFVAPFKVTSPVSLRGVLTPELPEANRRTRPVPNWLKPPFVLGDELSRPAINASPPSTVPPPLSIKLLVPLMLEVPVLPPGAAMFEPDDGP